MTVFLILLVIVGLALTTLGVIKAVQQSRVDSANNDARWEAYLDPAEGCIQVSVARVAKRGNKSWMVDGPNVIATVENCHPEFEIEVELARDRARRYAIALNGGM